MGSRDQGLWFWDECLGVRDEGLGMRDEGLVVRVKLGWGLWFGVYGFRGLSGRLNLTVRRHKFNKDSLFFVREVRSTVGGC